MTTVRDLVEEGKRRAVAVGICVLAVAYCMTLPSSSVWINIPVALCVVAGFRYLVLQLEIRWRVQEQGCSVREAAGRHRQTRSRNVGNVDNGGHGGKEGRWRRAVDSPVVEAAIEEFTDCVVNEWVLQLWFSALSPDREVPDEIRLLLNGVIGEVAQRARKVNLVSLLTRDVVDLVKGQLELFRRTQSRVGADVLARLSSEKRDEKLKQTLVASRELHPALVSANAEYEVLRRLMGEVVDLVLRPQDKQNKLLRGLARELLGCAVMRPIVNLANPGLINQVIEGRVQAARNKVHIEQPLKSSAVPVKVNKLSRTVSDDLALEMSTLVMPGEMASAGGQEPVEVDPGVSSAAAGASAQANRPYGGPRRQSSASRSWARTVDVTSNKKTTQVLAPEHLDNMWTKGRNYKKREGKSAAAKAAQLVPIAAPGKTQELEPARGAWEQVLEEEEEEVASPASTGSRTASLNVVHSRQNSLKASDQMKNVRAKNGPVVKKVQGTVGKMLLEDNDEEDVPGIGFAGAKWHKATGVNSAVGSHVNVEPLKVSEAKKHPLSFLDDVPLSADQSLQTQGQKASQPSSQHRRSRSGSGLESWQRGLDHQDGHWNSSRSLDANLASRNIDGQDLSPNKSASVKAPEEAGYGSGSMSGSSPDKFFCKVVGYHIVKDSSKPFVLYTISVRDSLNRIWKVQRRYRNFEQLHRRLKEIPYYDLNLPPKRYLSSNMEDAFILERCQLLDVYLQELISRPSISEQHEVWDFLSKNSVNYGFSASASMMKTLAGNVDDAVDDVFRHIRWVSDDIQEVIGIKKRVTVGSTSLVDSSFHASDLPQTLLLSEAAFSERGLAAHMLDEQDLGDLEDRPPQAQYDGAYSDSELPSRSSAHHQTGGYQDFSGRKTERALSEGHSPVESLGGSDTIDDELGIPQEWAPPKLSVPLLNLVDVIFQLQGRGWIRRQVFWMAKETLQLVMGDTLDDWLLSRIQWLRKEEVVASGISWVRGILWRDGLFITKRNAANNSTPRANNGPGSMGQPQPLTFEQQREAARRKEVVREVLIDNAPIALVSLIGRKEYQRCAKDIFYFLQSPLFVKQLGFSLLEILILAAFPELHDVVLDVRSSVM